MKLQPLITKLSRLRSLLVTLAIIAICGYTAYQISLVVAITPDAATLEAARADTGRGHRQRRLTEDARRAHTIGQGRGRVHDDAVVSGVRDEEAGSIGGDPERHGERRGGGGSVGGAGLAGDAREQLHLAGSEVDFADGVVEGVCHEEIAAREDERERKIEARRVTDPVGGARVPGRAGDCRDGAR